MLRSESVKRRNFSDEQAAGRLYIIAVEIKKMDESFPSVITANSIVNVTAIEISSRPLELLVLRHVSP